MATSNFIIWCQNYRKYPTPLLKFFLISKPKKTPGLMDEEIASDSSCSVFEDQYEDESEFEEDELDKTQHATDFSQNESHMSSYGAASSKYMAASSTGRSMKDLEEQLTQLKKENFNLKLRIYFAEERKKILQGAGHTDELVERIMKLQVEQQNLKTELCDKEDLIVQTAKAMESLEKGHDQRTSELRKLHDAQVKQLQGKIEQLEVDVTYSKFKHDSNCANTSNDALLKNYESQVANLEAKLSESQQVIVNLEAELGQSRHTISSLNSRVENLEQELSTSNMRVGEIFAEAKKSEQDKKSLEDEVRVLKQERDKLERNLQSKCDEVVRAKQDVCDKVLCSKRNEDELKSLKKQVNTQTSLVDQLTRNKREISQRIDQCEARLAQEQTRTEEMARQLDEERQNNEKVRVENEELRQDNEILKETLARSRSQCPPQADTTRDRSPSPSSPSQLFINIKPSDSSTDRLTCEYNALTAKHQALYESFTETCKRLEKTDGEYKKALGVIRNMVKENKKSAHALESMKEKLRLLEESRGDKCQFESPGGAGDNRHAHARGQPEGSNESFNQEDINPPNYVKNLRDKFCYFEQVQ